MSRLVCPECGEPVEHGTPRGSRTGYAHNVQRERLSYRHARDREPLCPIVTSRGYEPALPKRAR